jgi:hypothetical protein
MGYTTDFQGKLEFTTDLNADQLDKVRSFLGEYCGHHPEWDVPEDLQGMVIDLELTDDNNGLQWDVSEKTYYMVEAVNVIILNMRKEMPDFSLKGKFIAQGDDIGDTWELLIENGFAIKKEIPQTGDKITKMIEQKITIGGQEFNKKCPVNCPGKERPIDQGGICFRCPIFNCSPDRDGFSLLEPNNYRSDWALEFKKWFDAGMKDYPTLKLFNKKD